MPRGAVMKRAPGIMELWRGQVGGYITGLSWSPDGGRIVLSTAEGDLAVIDAASGHMQHTIRAHRIGIMDVQWSPRAPVIVSAGQDGYVRMWDPGALQLMKECAAGGAWVEHLAWSPTGEYLATAAGKHLRIWTQDGVLVQTSGSHESTISAVAWSGSGNEVATACYPFVRLYHHGTNVPYSELECGTLPLSLAWNPNGSSICAGTHDASVRFWMLPNVAGEDIEMSGFPGKVTLTRYDPAGRFLAVGGGDVILIWPVSGAGPHGRKPLVLAGHGQRVTALQYQCVGQVLASGDGEGSVMLWDHPRDHSPRGLKKVLGDVVHLAWSEDDTKLAIGTSAGEVVMLKPEVTGQE